MSTSVTAIHRFIVDFFSLAELDALCFSLFVDHENFESRGKEAKAREFVLYMERHDRLPALHAALARERPELYREQFGRTESPISQSPSLQSPISHNPHQIFISHAHEDAEFARRLAADLRADGWAVWIAPESIRPGERWVEAINRGLEESGVFVVVLTPAAVASRWVNTETNLAIGLEHGGSLRFIPLEVEVSRPPLLWTAYQYVQFHNGYMSGLADLHAWLNRSQPLIEQGENPGPLIKFSVPEPDPLPWSERFVVHEKTGIELIRIPAGLFLYREHKEVYLPDYWIGRAPVTNEQFERFVAATGYEVPRHWQGKRPPSGLRDHPVVYVSWDDAQAYCQWAGLRLPTEEEWEKAAWGWDGREYPWGNEPPNERLCNFNNNVKNTTSVGRYSPQGDSPYGCVDMAGNVWEWIDSWYDERKRNRVVRGGAFYSDVSSLRGVCRDGYFPNLRNDFRGFRVCASPFSSSDL